MSVELISILTAIVAVGVALAGVTLAGSRGLRQDMARLESRLDVRITALESRQEARLNELRGEIGELRERMAHEVSELRERVAKLEGLLEGLREAVTGRVAAG